MLLKLLYYASIMLDAQGFYYAQGFLGFLGLLGFYYAGIIRQGLIPPLRGHFC